MIHFMIDFENVMGRGLQGCEYLNVNDRVTIFYNKECSQIENKLMQQILSTGCDFDICNCQ